MISPRWQKIIRDLWLNLPRTLLVVFAIAIGIFGVGFVLDTYTILNREINTNYKSANPPSTTIWIDKADGNAEKIAQNLPGVISADKARPPIRSRVQIAPGQWKILILYVVEDFNDMKIGKFFPESGSWPPGVGNILIERASIPVIHAEAGKPITMRILNSDVHQLDVAGTVFDPSPDPAWVNDIASGYISPETYKWLGGKAATEEGLRITTGENIRDRVSIRSLADQLGSILKENGYNVKRIEVPIPGKYQQSDKSNSILLTLLLFGILCLILSGFITAALITALLSQQIRQIGVMKAIGATKRQIIGIYLGMVLGLSIAALIISIPLAVMFGRTFAFSTLEMLNFNVTDKSVPVWAYLVQIALGILVPMITALYPVTRGSRITVREAIRDYGVNVKDFGASRIDVFLKNFKSLPRVLTLSLRNTFRRKGRMLLALVMLAIGGASFIASLGSAASWNRTIEKSFANINYDIDIRLGKQYPSADIEKSISSIPGVKAVEAWGYSMSNAYPKFSDGTYGPSYAVFAPKNGSPMIDPPVVEGRWLKENDTNAIVLDTEFIDNAEKLGTPVKVGDDLILNIAGKDITWHVIGIMDKVGLQSAAYTNFDYFAQVIGQQGNAMCARVQVTKRSQDFEGNVIREIETKLAQDKINIFTIQPLEVSRQVVVNHVVLILSLLMFMSVLVALIGSLGLASTMSMNVMERTREIGIMRSIGATRGALLTSIVVEGVIIGIFSWFFGSILSIPLTGFIAENTGKFIFPRIMVIDYPLWIPGLWLLIVCAVSIVASFYPAWKATRLTVRETLSYE